MRSFVAVPCPHAQYGDPLNCSQCLGATPRRVVVEHGRDAIIRVDGEEPRYLRMDNQTKFVEENESGRPTRLRRCGRCLQSGHNARRCVVPEADLPSIRAITDRDRVRQEAIAISDSTATDDEDAA